jgi:hypothetical protein
MADLDLARRILQDIDFALEDTGNLDNFKTLHPDELGSIVFGLLHARRALMNVLQKLGLPQEEWSKLMDSAPNQPYRDKYVRPDQTKNDAVENLGKIRH